MSEAGRFASKSVTEASLKKRPVAYSSLERRIVEYVVSRQNKDGGYAFAQGLESNAQDTYYGLAILHLLGSPFPNLERTVEWLRTFGLGSIYSYYYVGKTLELCSERIDDGFRKFVSSLVSSKRYFGNVDVYVEIPSEFEFTLMTLELANLSKIELNGGDELREWLLKYRNNDGGFGAYKISNINSTYYAVASLSLMKVNRRDLIDAITYVRQCEKPYGGFTVVPRSFSPYMEHTYYGTKTLELLGESCRFPSQTIDFVLKCQRGNGGFARSDLGISTFENTFQAVSIMRRPTST